MNINPLNFTSRHINEVNIKNKNSTASYCFSFKELEYGLYDLTLLNQTTKNFDKNSKYKYGQSIFLDYIKTYFQDENEKKFFIMEDESGTIQTLLEATINKQDPWYLDYLYVNPVNSASSKNKKYKNLGSKCFCEFIKYAKGQNAQGIAFFNAQDGFWSKIPHLKRKSYGVICTLDKKDFNNCSKKLDTVG